LQLAAIFSTFLYSSVNEENEITSLSDLQRLLPGIERRLSSPQNEEKPSHNGKGKNVRVSLETEGRKGKA